MLEQKYLREIKDVQGIRDLVCKGFEILLYPYWYKMCFVKNW